jgi:hypothetical protein
VRGVQPRQLLVFQQRRDGRMVDAAQHRGPGRRHRDAGRAERPDDLGRRVGVDRPPAKGRHDLIGQRLQPPGPLGETVPPRAGRPRPQQLGEQPIVHLGPPRQPVVAQLRRDESARRLGRGQEPHPIGVLECRDTSSLVVVDGDDRVDVLGRRRGILEQRRLTAILAGRRLVVRHLGAAQPGVGGRHRTRLAVPGRVAEQHPLHQLEVMALRHPHPGAQQPRVVPVRGRPHPPRPAGAFVRRDRADEIGGVLGWARRHVVGGERLKDAAACRGHRHRDPHAAS